MIDWLAAPIDPSTLHDVSGVVAWHGRLMVLAWAVLLPLGILAARFFKVMPGQDWPNDLDNRTWWDTHRLLQYLGGTCLVAGLGLVLWTRTGAATIGFHAIFGWSVLALTAVQFLGAWLRGSKGGPTAPAPDGSDRGDHYDMTPRRLAFEYAHKHVGYAALGLSVWAIATGLSLTNAPRWMWLAVVVWWLLFALTFVLFQRQGRAIDTYQAIWGAGSEHPGNRRKPVGLGVRRWEKRRPT